MLGDTGVLASSGEDTVVAGALEGDEAAGVIEEDKGGDRSNCGGNRWPRPETLALLKIRSDMDAVFRDSSLKGPLWEDVSRKLGELGYSRSAKKCKEKFENVYKYHKRTKEGRTGKAEGKTYRFFDQLQALENQPEGKTTPAVHWTNSTTSTVPLTTNPTIMFQSNPIIPPIPAKNPAIPSAQTNILWRSSASTSLFSSTSTSSSTASDREFEEPARKRSKRKWKDFFQTLAMEVIEKQEQLQQKFLDTIEKHENERIVKEEVWRKQEMASLNREHEILIQERSTAAAKDAAVLALLHKISGQQQQQTHDVHDVNTTTTLSLPMPRPLPQQPPPPLSPASSSRWPKAEVQALINLRSVLDLKYQENGPKGPLWEEISAGMRRIGYSRSAKRCKEKWENINKYFKKVKGSNIKRPEDSKTCPYFHQLDALYKEKNKIINQMEPLMVEPEQQWPLQEDHNNQEQEIAAVVEDINIHHKENVEQNDGHQEDDNDIADSTDEEDDGGGYEMVINKPSSVENIAK